MFDAHVLIDHPIAFDDYLRLMGRADGDRRELEVARAGAKAG